TPECLARHPIKQVISRLRFASTSRELSGIVGSPKLVQPGIASPPLNAVEGTYRSSLLSWTESNFRDANGNAAELWNESCWVMGKRITVLSFYHGFHVYVPKRDNADFHGRCRRRVEGFEISKEISERIPHRLKNERCSVMRSSVEILTRELTYSRRKLLVQPSLLKPPRIEAESRGTGHAT